MQEALSLCPRPPFPLQQTYRLDLWCRALPSSFHLCLLVPITSEGCWLFTWAHMQLHHNLCHLCNHSQSAGRARTSKCFDKSMHIPRHTCTNIKHIWLSANMFFKIRTFAVKVTHFSLIVYTYLYWAIQSILCEYKPVLRNYKTINDKNILRLTWKRDHTHKHKLWGKERLSRKLKKCNLWNKWWHADTESHESHHISAALFWHPGNQKSISSFAAFALFSAERFENECLSVTAPSLTIPTHAFSPPLIHLGCFWPLVRKHIYTESPPLITALYFSKWQVLNINTSVSYNSVLD